MTVACLAELIDEPLLQRIVVVDNASSDETAAALIERFGARLDVVSLATPHGFASACNRGSERGNAQHVLFLNSDILVTPGAIETLVAELERDPDAVAAGGRLVDPDDLTTQSGYRPRPFPTLFNFAVVITGLEEFWPGNPVTRRYHGEALADSDTVAVDQPAAAALLVPRERLAAVGGFDERFWFWFEDSDLLARLHRGGKVLYVPKASFRHLGGGTFRRWTKPQRIRSVHHGMVHYADAQFARRERVALGLLLLLVSAPRLALFGRNRPDEAKAWRAVATAAVALVRGHTPPAIAP